MSKPRSSLPKDTGISPPHSPAVIRAVPAVTRGLAILRLLAAHRDPMGVNAIARELDIIPSTALHILRALLAEGMVGVDPVTKRYGLDAGVLTLARSALRQDGFARLAQSGLDDLARRFPVTAIGVRLIGLKHMVVVGISRSDAAFRLQIDIGSRFPALISATGRCLAAFGSHSDKEVEAAFRALRWDAAPSYPEWRAEVADTKRRGYGVDAGNYIRGVSIVAAPVLGIAGTMTHAIVAVALSDQVAKSELATIGKELKRSAGRISALLGGAAEIDT